MCTESCAMIKLAKEGTLHREGGEFLLFYLVGGVVMRAKRRDKLFSEYPDVVTVKQMCAMLGGIGAKTAYGMLERGEIRYMKIGKSFKIPKICIIEYLIGED